MHNSNNPAVGKVIFTGTLLAQAKLLGISTNINNSTTKKLQDAVNTDTDLKVHVIPSFFKPKVQNFNVPQSLVKYLEKQSRKLREQLEPYQLQLLDKAYEYGINTNFKLGQDFAEYDFNSLEDKVYQWEDLLERANDLGLAWDENDYDVIVLQQEIESYESSCFQEQQALYSDFLASRRV
jgi:hypothetical protein